MSAPLQRRLARLLRDGEVRVARRAAPVVLDVRVIAAVEDRLDTGLREELLRRLPLTVEVPALRQRRKMSTSSPRRCWRTGRTARIHARGADGARRPAVAA